MEFLLAMGRCRDRRQWAATLAGSGANLFPAARISAVRIDAGVPLLQAVTGVSEPARDSATVQCIQQAALAFYTSGQSVGAVPAEAASSSSGQSSASRFACRLHESVGIADSTDPASWVVIAELFDAVDRRSADSRADTDQSRFEILANAAARTLPDCCQTGTAETGNLFPAASRKRWTHRTRAIIAVIVLAVALVPVELEVEAQGQLLPAGRQRIFAPEDGIVKQLLVEEDQTVQAGTPLLQLRSPQLDLTIGRLAGEIESTQARLRTIRAARNAGRSANPDPASESASGLDLSGEEQQAIQRLEALEAERQLVTSQRDSLRICATSAGVVHQPQLAQRLAGRPVQRGEWLLELQQPNGPWIAELWVPEAQTGPVLQAMQAPGSSTPSAGLSVRLQLPADPGQVLVAPLTRVEHGCRLVRGELVCVATVALPDAAQSEVWRRSGTGVTARIACGRRPLILVWGREVIEFCQRTWFAWSPF
jgi:hypothetical protein